MGEHDGRRDRLRKYFLRNGMDVMRDSEILELLLYYAVPRKDTNAIARKLLNHFRSFSAIFDASPEELQEVGGIGESAAVLLHMITPLSRRYLQSKSDEGVVLSSTNETGLYVLPYFFGETDELVYLLCLDAKNKLLCCRQLHRGVVNTVQLSIRKAAEIAIACKASSVILAHNHPDGLPLPSDSDYMTTELFQDVFTPLGINLIDHIIVANDTYTSMRDTGHLSQPR